MEGGRGVLREGGRRTRIGAPSRDPPPRRQAGQHPDVAVRRGDSADFGIARIASQGTVTATGSVSGTPLHLAPELVGGAKPSVESDVYSLGSTLYELVAGKPAFLKGEDDNVLAVMARLTTEAPPPLSGVPFAASDAIQTAMAKAPEADATAADLGRRLRRCRRPRASRPSPCPSQPARRSPMHGEPPRWTAGSSTPSRLRPRMRPAHPPPSDPGPCGQHSARGNPVPSGTHRQRRPQPLERTTEDLGAEAIVHTGPRSRWSASRILRPPAEAARHGRLPVPALVAIAAVVLLGGAALAFALLSGGGGGEDLSPGGAARGAGTGRSGRIGGGRSPGDAGSRSGRRPHDGGARGATPTSAVHEFELADQPGSLLVTAEEEFVPLIEVTDPNEDAAGGLGCDRRAGRRCRIRSRRRRSVLDLRVRASMKARTATRPCSNRRSLHHPDDVPVGGVCQPSERRGLGRRQRLPCPDLRGATTVRCSSKATVSKAMPPTPGRPVTPPGASESTCRATSTGGRTGDEEPHLRPVSGRRDILTSSVVPA